MLCIRFRLVSRFFGFKSTAFCCEVLVEVYFLSEEEVITFAVTLLGKTAATFRSVAYFKIGDARFKDASFMNL